MSDETYLLVISPHPDDCEFGVAGTAARLSREGKNVVYVICTNGDKGSVDMSLTSEKLVKVREKEELAAAKILGVKEVVFLGWPDQGLEDCDGFRRDLVRVIRRFKPYAVATCDPYRKYMNHRDHRIAGVVAADAVYPFARDHLSYPELLKEGLEPHSVREIWFWGTEDSNFKQDITDTIDLKLEALKCHVSQFGELPPEMKSRLREFSKMAAKDEKFGYAEAFHRVELRP